VTTKDPQDSAEELFQQWLEGYTHDIDFPTLPFLEQAEGSECRHQLEEIFSQMNESPTNSLDATDRLQESIKLSNYSLISEIASGSTGTIWRAFDNTLRREVAVKIAREGLLSSGEIKKRFLREGRAAAAIKHPSIVDVIGVGEDHNRQFIVFELIRGARTLAANNKPHTANAKNFSSMCEALNLAHSKVVSNDCGNDAKLGLVHGDIKPANILIDPDGTFKLADFGAASFKDDFDDCSTQNGNGTRAYWSPQMFEWKETDHYCDQWAMGVTMWEFFTGQHPFYDSETTHGQLAKRISSTAPSCGEAQLPLDLHAILLKMLSKDPSKRYSDFAAVADDLNNFANGRIVKARRPSMVELSNRWARRNKVFLALFLLSLSTTAVFAFAVKQTKALATNVQLSAGYTVGLLNADLQEHNLEKRLQIYDTITVIENHIRNSTRNDTPVDAMLFKAVGQEYLKLHNSAAAVTALEHALKLNLLKESEHHHLLSLLASAYINNDQPLLAVALLKKVIDASAQDATDLAFLQSYNLYGKALSAAEHQDEAEDIFRDIHRKYVKLDKADHPQYYINEFDLLNAQLPKYYSSTKYQQRCDSWIVLATEVFGEAWKHLPPMYALLAKAHTLDRSHQQAAFNAERAVSLALRYQAPYQPSTIDLQIQYIDSLIAVNRNNEAKYLVGTLANTISDLKGRASFAETDMVHIDLSRFDDLQGRTEIYHAINGYIDTPTIVGQSWQIHSPLRPAPARALPREDTFSPPPPDAIVLFDGTGLSNWTNKSWLADNGAMTCGSGETKTVQSFGDCQLHIEFRIPESVNAGQNMGNSGIFLMGNYEVQVLSSYDNPTYADGSCGAIYGQFPPLVNVSRANGEWQSYDIYFTRPRFDHEEYYSSAPRITVVQNGVPIHIDRELFGATRWKSLPEVKHHAERLPISLQDHGSPVSYRNIWIRDLEQE
jgi:serine/threonine protein kinase